MHTDSTFHYLGMDSIAAALDAEKFPMDKENLYYSIGDMWVQRPNGKDIPIRDVLDHVEAVRFDSPGQAVEALGVAIERLQHH